MLYRRPTSDPMLTALAALTSADNKGLYFTGEDAPALYDLTAFGRSMAAPADAAAGRNALGASSGIWPTALGGTGKPSFPKFQAAKDGDQAISAGAWAKVTFGWENFDEGNCFAGSTWTPNVAGHARLSLRLKIAWGAGGLGSLVIAMRKNGAADANQRYLHESVQSASSGILFATASVLVPCNGTTDNFEVWLYNEFNGVVATGYQGAISAFEGEILP